MLWSLTLKRLIVRGCLRVTDAGGKVHRFGKPHEQPDIAIRLHSRITDAKLLFNPGLYFGEAYMDGTLTIEEGTLRDVFKLFYLNFAVMPRSFFMRLHEGMNFLLRRLQQYNPAPRSLRNVAHHYDLSDAFYEMFLDKDMQYSCGYFVNEDDSLEEAQYNKKRHIAAKLRIEPGMRVLDIGCGWGGMALYLARELGVQVVGLTLSKEQFNKATARVREAGLEKQVEIRLRDWRDEQGEYDRIVSVGMFEHVGSVHYEEFFAHLKTLLKPRGVALLHSIGRMDTPCATNAWLRKYIFPGGYSPALSEVFPAVEKAGLWPTDMEILRLHYGLTIAQWHKRFQANRERIADMMSERFCRMWEFYLMAVEAEFNYSSAAVFQLQLTRSVNATPIVRDYMFDTERALASPQKLPSPRRYALH